MKLFIYVIGILGILISCSDPKTGGKKSVSFEKVIADTSSIIPIVSDQKKYLQIILQENSIDSFSLPFPEEKMLQPLRKYYEAYTVKANIGKQDGPDFVYIDILRFDTPVVYFNFDSENDLALNSIIVLDSTVNDQYGLNVGSTFMEIRQSRGNGKINFDPYHQHVYYHYENSNISYEINGDLKISPDVIDMKDLVITENDVKDWTVSYIIWKNK